MSIKAFGFLGHGPKSNTMTDPFNGRKDQVTIDTASALTQVATALLRVHVLSCGLSSFQVGPWAVLT